jgi:hypothetical protein
MKQRVSSGPGKSQQVREKKKKGKKGKISKKRGKKGNRVLLLFSETSH